MSGDVLRTLRAAREEGHGTGVELEGLRTVPGALVRVVAGVMAALVPLVAGFAAIRGPLAVPVDALAVGFVVLVVVRPYTGWCAWLVLMAGLRVLAGPAAGPGLLAALLLVVHLAVITSLLAGRVSWGTRVEVAVPVAMLRRAWPFQVGAQAAALLVWLVGPGRGLAGGELWRLAALGATVVLVVVVLPAVRRR